MQPGIPRRLTLGRRAPNILPKTSHPTTQRPANRPETSEEQNLVTDDSEGVLASQPPAVASSAGAASADGASELVNIDELLRDFSWKINCDAAALETKLQSELTTLESENIHGLIESSAQTRLVCAQIDRALLKLDELAAWVSHFANDLSSMSSKINYIEDQHRLLHTQAVNQAALMSALDRLVSSLSLPPAVLDTLLNTPLITASAATISSVEDAANRLHAAMQTQLDPNLRHMRVVCEQGGQLHETSSKFARRVLEACIEILLRVADAFVADRTRVTHPPGSLPFHLEPYDEREARVAKLRPLIAWTCKVEPKFYASLLNQYVLHVARVNRADINDLLECVRGSLPSRYTDGQESFFQASVFSEKQLSNNNANSSASASGGGNIGTSAGANNSTDTDAVHYLLKQVALFSSQPTTKSLLDSHRKRNGSLRQVDGSKDAGTTPNTDEQYSFISAFSQMLALIVPLIQREQNFMTVLFGLGEPAEEPKRREKIDSESSEGTIEDEFWYLDLKNVTISNIDNVRQLLGSLFPKLQFDLGAILDLGLKDSGISLPLLNTVEKVFHTTSSQQNFLLDSLFTLQSKLRGGWSRFILLQLRSIQECKHSKKKSGILPFVRGVPLFLEYVEKAAENPPDSVVLLYENGVDSVMKALIEAVESLDGDDSLILENAFLLHHLIRDYKFPVMQGHISKIATISKNLMDTYFKYLLRKTFGRFLEFFGGIESLVATQTPEEVIYQASYNKAAAKRVLGQYNQKELMKCFEYCHKKMLKLLTEPTVIAHVWVRVFNEFRALHNSVREIIKTVYNSELSLEYSYEELKQLHSTFVA